MREFSMTRHLAQGGLVGALIGLSLLVSGCHEARGGGTLGAPLPSGTVLGTYQTVLGTYQGKATFGFTFTCAVENGSAVVHAVLSYHDHALSELTLTADGAPRLVHFPRIDLLGRAEPLVLDVPTCEDITELHLPVAQFRGVYRPQRPDRTMPAGQQAEGRFEVQVFDQGEPGQSMAEITGDAFAIQLIGGRYHGYTRAGYIEDGNIQVR